ncbi:hypothetical protein [Butyricimonas sp.]|nr:hypothetical protein [Butyricimonas sp.]
MIVFDLIVGDVRVVLYKQDSDRQMQPIQFKTAAGGRWTLPPFL